MRNKKNVEDLTLPKPLSLIIITYNATSLGARRFPQHDIAHTQT